MLQGRYLFQHPWVEYLVFLWAAAFWALSKFSTFSGYFCALTPTPTRRSKTDRVTHACPRDQECFIGIIIGGLRVRKLYLTFVSAGHSADWTALSNRIFVVREAIVTPTSVGDTGCFVELPAKLERLDLFRSLTGALPLTFLSPRPWKHSAERPVIAWLFAFRARSRKTNDPRAANKSRCLTFLRRADHRCARFSIRVLHFRTYNMIRSMRVLSSERIRQYFVTRDGRCANVTINLSLDGSMRMTDLSGATGSCV